MKWERFRNLQRRPAKPALGNGRIQRGVRRAFYFGSEVTSSAVYNWVYPRRRHSLTQTTPPMKWEHHRNLHLRPHAPARDRGRLQVQIRRAFMVHGPVVSSSSIYDWCYARRRLMLGKPLTLPHRYSVWRILVTMADPIGRGTGSARPTLWRLRIDKLGKKHPIVP
jgi:hypothetical protein